MGGKITNYFNPKYEDSRNVSGFQCFRVSVFQNVSECLRVSMFQGFSVSECFNVSVFKLSETLKLCNSETLKLTLPPS